MQSVMNLDTVLYTYAQQHVCVCVFVYKREKVKGEREKMPYYAVLSRGSPFPSACRLINYKYCINA